MSKTLWCLDEIIDFLCLLELSRSCYVWVNLLKFERRAPSSWTTLIMQKKRQTSMSSLTSRDPWNGRNYADFPQSFSTSGFNFNQHSSCVFSRFLYNIVRYSSSLSLPLVHQLVTTLWGLRSLRDETQQPLSCLGFNNVWETNFLVWWN